MEPRRCAWPRTSSSAARNLILAGEIFNALNANTALYRNPQANGTTFNRLDEILAPRIARVSARFTF